MSILFTLVHLAALVCFIVFLVKMLKLKKAGDDHSQAKKFMLISIAVWFISFIIVGVTTPSSEKTENEVAESSVEESTPEAEESHDKTIEVMLDASGKKDGNSIVFELETNLPDETELMLTLSKGDYNTDDSFRAQGKVIIKDGKAISEPFSSKGEPLNGDYDLSVSMSLPSLQSDAVRAVIGEKGENITGKLVKSSEIGDSNVVNALFTVATEGDIKIEASDDYQYTIFADEVSDATADEENSAEEGIILEAGIPGEYGQDLVLNAGTEFEDNTIGYFVPSGKYRVTNIGEHQTQVNVYKNEKNVVDGWEEWADCNVELLAVNGTTEMVVDDGYFFNIDPPARIRIEKID